MKKLSEVNWLRVDWTRSNGELACELQTTKVNVSIARQVLGSVLLVKHVDLKKIDMRGKTAKEVAKITGQNIATIYLWHKNNPDCGLIVRKQKERKKTE